MFFKIINELAQSPHEYMYIKRKFEWILIASIQVKKIVICNQHIENQNRLMAAETVQHFYQGQRKYRNSITTYTNVSIN